MSSGRTICHSSVVLKVPWVVWTIYREFLRIWPSLPSLLYSPLLFPHCLNSYHKELPITSKSDALFLPTFPWAMSAKNAHPCLFPLASLWLIVPKPLFITFNGVYNINEGTQWTHLFCRWVCCPLSSSRARPVMKTWAEILAETK